MPAPNGSTFDGNPNTSPATTIPYRPGASDFNGCALVDNPLYPPNPQLHPTAALLNTLCLMAVVFGRMIAVLRASVTGGTTPAISQYIAAPDNLSYFPASPWVTGTVYALNAYVVPTASNGFYYQATVGGTSGVSQPTWPTTIGATVVDGGVTWKCIGVTTFVVNRVSVGKVQITWPGNTFPTPVCAPEAKLNGVLTAGHNYSISATAITNGVEVDTLVDGAYADMSFTVSQW